MGDTELMPPNTEPQALAPVEGQPLPVRTNSVELHAGLGALAEMSDSEFDQKLAGMKQAITRRTQIINELLRESVDWMKIPGTPKPSLLQPGAEKLASMYNLVAVTSVNCNYGDGSKSPEIDAHAHVRLHVGEASGPCVATADASCNSWEDKYKWRNEWVDGEKQRVPNDNPYGMKHVLETMAAKRAFVLAVRRATQTTDVFTQDEDLIPSTPSTSTRPAKKAATTNTANDIDECARRLCHIRCGDISFDKDKDWDQHFWFHHVVPFASFEKDGETIEPRSKAAFLRSAKWAGGTLRKMRDELKRLEATHAQEA